MQTVFIFHRIQCLRLESTDSSSIISYYENVRIFKSDLQAVCDSLVFDQEKDQFKLFKDPVIWASDSSQFFADSIIIQMDSSEQIDRIYLYHNAMIVQTEDFRTFNQMRGKTMEAVFSDGALDKMLIRGNAESIYFALDETKAYIGVNKCLTSNMDIVFVDNAIQTISFLENQIVPFIPYKM